MATAGHSAIVI